MTIYYYTNTSPGAPTLTGAAGSLITLLDWLLVTNLGWTKEFSGTNLASYRAATGNRFYLGVDDTTTLYSRVRGFETMTAAGVAVASGTGPFPTAAQASNGQFIYKSSNPTSKRAWRFISDGTMFYLSNEYGTNTYNLSMFGDFISFRSGDSYNTVLSADYAASNGYSCLVANNLGYVVTSTYANYTARSFSQISNSAMGHRVVNYPVSSNKIYIGVVASIPYPSPVESCLIMDRLYVGEGAYIRGMYPGLWHPVHDRPFSNNDTFQGTGSLSGKSFVVWDMGTYGQVFMETSDTWQN